MAFFLAMVLLWLVFGRWGRWSRYACMSALSWDPGRGRMHACGRSRYGRGVEAVHRVPRRGEQEGALELLKRRYVTGELSDEQYEAELDSLFRATSVRGRA